MLEFTCKSTFLKDCSKVFLKKNDKKSFFQIFFQLAVLFNLDWIWKQPEYVKASAGAALKASNDGLVIFGDMERKSGKILER